MIKAPINLQDLRRRIYLKAKAEKSWRFWGLYVHVCKMETLREAYKLAKKNDGAPGTDGVTFEAIEAKGMDKFLMQIRDELVSRTYRPMRVRKVEIPKDGGKRVRVLSIPTIRDRVVQGALKLILEPIFEADFQPGSYGYRPKKSPQEALQRVSEAIIQGKTHVIDFDLRAYFDNVRHHIVLEKVAGRVDDGDVMHLLKMILKATGKRGVPQGGVISPLLSNIYLNEDYFRSSRSQPVERVVEQINPVLRGWVNYFAVGHSSRCFSFIRQWVERKMRRHLARARMRRGFGWSWRRWSRQWLYDSLGLFNDYRVKWPLLIASPADRPHKP